MSRPDYAFRTPSHTWRETGEAGVYRGEPGGAEIRLTIEAQHVPEALLDEPLLEKSLLENPLRRAVTAWVLARGGRRLHLNGEARAISPGGLDRPPTGPVARVVSIAPSNAEIVGGLAAADLLVGVESSTDFPPEVTGLPRLGPDLHVDMEALAALKPDLVLASLTVPGMERNIAALDALGLPMLVTAPQSLEGIQEDLLRVGAAIGREQAAREAVARMERSLSALEAGRPAGPPVRVLLQWWHQPIFTPGEACWSNALIERAGGVNVFRGLPGQSAQVTPEAVAEADPEVIFLSWCGVPREKLNPRRVLRRADLASVTAVREGRVYALDEALVGRPGPRVVQGIARMAELLRGGREVR